MADPRDHDAPIWAITMGGIRRRAKHEVVDLHADERVAILLHVSEDDATGSGNILGHAIWNGLVSVLVVRLCVLRSESTEIDGEIAQPHDGMDGHGNPHAEKYVVARFCPFDLSFFSASPSLRMRGTSRTSSPSVFRISFGAHPLRV